MGTENILQLQDNGYKNTVSAIAEIVDNSIQAESSHVEIIIVKNLTRSHDEIDEILIVDNGTGMDSNTFDKALQMSSGTRSNAKSGLGKYGQGLPNSSISQTKRVEVFTCQSNKVLFNYIDLDEIFQSGEAYLPDIQEKKSIDIPIFQDGTIPSPSNGTIVRWVKPNRVKPKTAKILRDHINQIAGRVFRHYIVGYEDKNGKKVTSKLSILVYDYNGETYSRNDFLSVETIKPFDPMFLMKGTQMENEFKESKHPTSVLLDDPIKETFTVDYNNERVKTQVEIRISYCKPEERARYGRNAGQTSFGKTYLKRNMIGTSGYNNISIVREGREIDCGNFGFITDVSDPRERWWSAEIHVDPVIDSIIGIDNKKQQASNIRAMDQEELTDPETHEILKWISIYLEQNLKTVRTLILEQNANNPGGGKGTKPGGLPPGGQSEPGNPGGNKPTTKEHDKIRKDFFAWIKERYPDLLDDEIWEIVDHALSIRDNHIFIKSDLGDTALYSYKVFGTKVLIEINYNHSFYRRFVQQFESDPNTEKSLRSIRLLIGSLVNAEIQNTTQDKDLIKDRRNIRNRFAESLDDYIEDLYSS
jgi:hypothetical protein